MKAATWWPVAIAGVLAVTVAANIAVMIAAGVPDTGVIESDYYRKAVAWDSTLAQERRDVALGWRLDAKLTPLGRGETVLEATLADRDGVPLADASIDVEAIHNRLAHAVTAHLVAGGGGVYHARLPLTRPGLWELRFTATRDTRRFTHTLRLDLPLAQLPLAGAVSRP